MPRPDYDFHADTMDRDRDRDGGQDRQDRDYRDRDRYRARSAFRDGVAQRASGSRYDHDSGRNRMRDRNGRDPRFGSDAYRDSIPMDETRKLIASNKVEGTPVYDRGGDRCGSIHNFMVEKRSGQVVYAVLKHSAGFLGFDDRYYPLHWDELTYDTRLDGYRVNVDQDQLMNRGSYDSMGQWSSGRDRSRERESDRRDNRDRADRTYNSQSR